MPRTYLSNQDGDLIVMTADCIVMDSDAAYKLTGPRYPLYGFRVTPQVLEDIPHGELKPGKNPITPIKVYITKKRPQYVIDVAPFTRPLIHQHVKDEYR